MNLLKTLRAMFRAAPRVMPAECAARVRSGGEFLVDVREAGEWTSGVAECAVLLPPSDLTGARAQWTPFLADARGREILLYCGAGVRSGMAARILVSEGFRAANTGSLNDWLKSGWPVTQPTRAA